MDNIITACTSRKTSQIHQLHVTNGYPGHKQTEEQSDPLTDRQMDKWNETNKNNNKNIQLSPSNPLIVKRTKRLAAAGPNA